MTVTRSILSQIFPSLPSYLPPSASVLHPEHSLSPSSSSSLISPTPPSSSDPSPWISLKPPSYYRSSQAVRSLSLIPPEEHPQVFLPSSLFFSFFNLFFSFLSFFFSFFSILQSLLLLSPPPTEFSLLDFFLCLLRELERLLEEDEEDDEDEEELEVDLLFLDICLINSFELNNPFLDRDLFAFFSFFLLREDPERLLDRDLDLYSLLLLLRGIA